MTSMKQIIFTCVFVCALLSTAAGQESASSAAQRSTLTITAAATGERVRITAPASVVQLRVEVYAASGEKLLDQEIRGGNVFDWHLQDGQAQRLAPGSYVCVVTAKSISGKITQKVGTVKVEQSSASVHPAESLSASQAQTIGPVEENSSWTTPAEDEARTPRVIARDPTVGQMTSGRGAVSFRPVNFFSSNDQRQMRQTEAGNLGFRTSGSKAKLGATGTISAERGLSSKPKTSGVRAADTLAANAADSVQPLIPGPSTQNQIAKFTDNAGTVGDSGITEASGNIGIGTTAPIGRLDVVQSASVATINQTNAGLNVENSNANGDAMISLTGGGAGGSGIITAMTTAQAPLPLRFYTGTSEKMRIDPNGNVAIGTTIDSLAKLKVAGGSSRHGVYGESTVFEGAGVFGSSSVLNGVGVEGSSSGVSGAGVKGYSIGKASAGVYGESKAGYGVSGFSADGVGIYGRSNGGDAGHFQGNLIVTGNIGVGYMQNGPIARIHVETDGITNAIYANNTSSNGGVGVLGRSTTGIGVFGRSTDGTGVYALSLTGNIMAGFGAGNARKFHINNNGTYTAGSDFAEALPARGGKSGYEPGDVLVVSIKAPGTVEKASGPDDVRLAGVYSTRPGMLGADKQGTSRVDEDEVPVAIVGIVPTKVSAENGAVQVGDLLTTSRTPGYAMKASPILMRGGKVYRTGTILGKALEPLMRGKGLIKVLVTLR